MRALRLIAAVASATAVFSFAAGDGPPPVPPLDPSGPVVIRYDDAVTRAEPGPHGGGGDTTANRYFDDVPDAGLVFRRRSLHPGSAIGVHPLRHDEVYYVLSGRGELTVNEMKAEVMAGAAIFLREGASVGLRQLGESDLVIIIAYPPFED
jgi:mannose-6-phosphate isomerase-like protein (cupin superfamily)